MAHGGTRGGVVRWVCGLGFGTWVGFSFLKPGFGIFILFWTLAPVAVWAKGGTRPRAGGRPTSFWLKRDCGCCYSFSRRWCWCWSCCFGVGGRPSSLGRGCRWLGATRLHIWAVARSDPGPLWVQQAQHNNSRRNITPAHVVSSYWAGPWEIAILAVNLGAMYSTVPYRHGSTVEFIPLPTPWPRASLTSAVRLDHDRRGRVMRDGRRKPAVVVVSNTEGTGTVVVNSPWAGRWVGGLVQTEPCSQATGPGRVGSGPVRGLEGWHGHILQSIGHIEYDVPAWLGCLR